MNPTSINHQIYAAIKPQLAELRSLEKHHLKHARLERHRQEMRMFDESDLTIELHLARHSTAAAFKVVKKSVVHIGEAMLPVMRSIWDAISGAFSIEEDGEPGEPAPTPAQDHVNLAEGA